MLCELCEKNQANVHITKIVNGVREEKNLCDQCAKKVEGFNLGGEIEITSPVSFQNILSGIMDYMSQTTPSKTAADLICENCGTSYREFKETGLLGCSKCYKNFSSTLIPAIKRVQGNIEHTGKIPLKSGKRSLLKENLLS